MENINQNKKDITNEAISNEELSNISGGDYFDVLWDSKSSPKYHVGQEVKVYADWRHNSTKTGTIVEVYTLGNATYHPRYKIQYSDGKTETTNASDIAH